MTPSNTHQRSFTYELSPCEETKKGSSTISPGWMPRFNVQQVTSFNHLATRHVLREQLCRQRGQDNVGFVRWNGRSPSFWSFGDKFWCLQKYFVTIRQRSYTRQMQENMPLGHRGIRWLSIAPPFPSQNKVTVFPFDSEPTCKSVLCRNVTIYLFWYCLFRWLASFFCALIIPDYQ